MNKLILLIKNSIGGGITRVILTSLLATLACAGIVYAATTVGTNISTTGTLNVAGATTFTTASSTGIVKFSQINSDTGEISFGDENLTTTGTLNVSGLTILGNTSSTILSVSGNSFLATTTVTGGFSVTGDTSITGKFSAMSNKIGDSDQQSSFRVTYNDPTTTQTDDIVFADAYYMDGDSTIAGDNANYGSVNWFRPTRDGVNMNFTGSMLGLTTIPLRHFSRFLGAGTATLTINQLVGMRVIPYSISDDVQGALNITEAYGIYIKEPTHAGSGFPDSNMTVGTHAGIRIDKQSFQQANAYGLLLGGTGKGSDVAFGTTSPIRMYKDASTGNLTIDGDVNINGSLNGYALPFYPTSYISSLYHSSGFSGIWNFNEPSYLPLIIDTSGNNKHMTASAGLTSADFTTTATGLTYLTTTDDNEYATFTDSESLFTYPDKTGGLGFSIGAWVYIHSATASQEQVIIRKYSGAYNREFHLINYVGNKLSVSLVSSNPDQAFCISISDSTIGSDAWYFVGVSYNPPNPLPANYSPSTTTELTLWKDGVLMPATLASNCNNYSAYEGMKNTTSDLVVGAGMLGSPMKGNLGTVFITKYGNTLSADTWLEMFNKTKFLYGK